MLSLDSSVVGTFFSNAFSLYNFTHTVACVRSQFLSTAMVSIMLLCYCLFYSFSFSNEEGSFLQVGAGTLQHLSGPLISV
jgi:hypothetical protein